MCINVRINIEKKEELHLSPFAAKSSKSLGREVFQEEDNVRTCWMRDRDRIIHSHAFRREKDKSQVFILPSNDHIMNRLTHTMEVTTVAKTIACALNLNESLTETIALGHDTAHTCFGHAGEDVLNKLNPNGYNHAKEAYRRLNQISKLNLTKEVLDGIEKHSGLSNDPTAITLEGKIIPFADKIAYLTSDIDNAITLKLIPDIPEVFKNGLGNNKSEIMKTLIESIVDTSYEKNFIKMDEVCYSYFAELREFCFHEIYFHSRLLDEKNKAKMIVNYLFEYFMKYPEEMKDIYDETNLEQSVTDYIAGMTDKYAMQLFTNFY